MRLSARERDDGPPPRRCPLCQEDGRGAERVVATPGLRASWVACDRCHTAYHEACATEFGVCATLGCERAAGLVFPRLEPSDRIRVVDGALRLPRPFRIGCLLPFAVLTTLGLGISTEALSLLYQGHLSLLGFLPGLPFFLLTLMCLYLIPSVLIHALAREVVHLEPGQVRIETSLGWSCSYAVPSEEVDRCVVSLTKSAEWKVMLLDAEGKTLRKFAYRLLSLEDALFVAQQVEAHVRGPKTSPEPVPQPEKPDLKRERA